jgi:uncharacterized surface protein with fasciclin (FAS1) repeats
MKNFLLLAALTVGFCSGAFAQTQKPTTTTKKDVVEIAVASADHSTLVAAIQSAGLTETLKGKGPFTIFAPTNAAFEQMMQDKWNQGTMQGTQDSMRGDNTWMERDTMNMGNTYRNDPTYRNSTQDTSTWNRNRTTQDTSSTWNRNRNTQDTSSTWNRTMRTDTTVNQTQGSTARTYRDTLSNRTNQTAQTYRDSSGMMNSQFRSANKQEMTDVLKYHVVSGTYDAAALKQAIKAGNGKAKLTTLNGAQLSASLQGSDIYLEDAAGNRAKVTTADLRGSNGVVHVIDHVVIPKTKMDKENRGK